MDNKILKYGCVVAVLLAICVLAYGLYYYFFVFFRIV